MKQRVTVLFVLLFVFSAGLYAQILCTDSESYTVSPMPGAGNTYAAGQIVTFCYTVSGYNQVGSVSNWFHGLTINFGAGWDSSTLTPVSIPPAANPPTGSSPDSPNVWMYFPNGITSYATGTTYGPGFYFETGEGESGGSDAYDGNPGDNYGDDCISDSCSWTFCFSVEVSPTAPAGTSLSLSVLPTGDGESGSWSTGAGECIDPPYTISTAVVGGNILIASVTDTNVTCFGLCNGRATVLGVNGSPPYTYKWSTSPVQTTPSVTNLCNGTYTVTVTDAQTHTATATCTITQPVQLSIVDSIVNPTCSGGSCNGAVITQISGGTMPYTYTWVGGAAPNSSVDYSLCAGLAKLTVTDSMHCVLNDSFNLIQPGAGTINLVSQTNASCSQAGSITVNYTGGSGGTTTYTWSNGVSGATDTGLVAGPYTVTATDSIGCKATATYTITQPANSITLQTPVITQATCTGINNGAIDASATGGTGTLTYAWTESSNSNHYTGANITGLAVDTYILTVTDGNGCSVTASYQVTAPPSIVIDSLVTQNVSCFGNTNGAAQVYSHGGATPIHYQWSISPADTVASIAGLPAGAVTVTITDANHCQAYDSATITQPAALVITNVSQTNSSCSGGSNSSITISASGGVPAYRYAWNNGNTTTTDSNLVAGIYTVTVTDANNCTVSKTDTVTQPSALVSNPEVQNVLCFAATNGQIDANPTGGTPPYSYKWSNGDSTETATGLAPATYTGTITDNSSCTVTFTGSISEPPQLNISFTPYPVKCIGQQNGSVVVSLTGGSPPYGFSATQDSVNFIYGSNDSITGLDTGTYVLLFSDNNGCTQEKSAYIPNATPDTFATTVDSTSCYGPDYNDGSVLLDPISTQNAPYQYSIDNGIVQDTGYFAGLSAGAHTVYTTSAFGCLDTIPIVVYQPAKILVSIDPDSLTLSLGTGKAVLVSYLNASSPSFNWTPGIGLSCIDCPNPVVTPYTNTVYTVTVSEQKTTATCYANATLTVVVNPFTPVFIPNAFSPNGDGNDDVFKIYGANISAVNMRVFNRWGELVFETSNAQSGWDGTYKGQIQEPNVYIYEATITFLDNSQVEKKGSFTLVR